MFASIILGVRRKERGEGREEEGERGWGERMEEGGGEEGTRKGDDLGGAK